MYYRSNFLQRTRIRQRLNHWIPAAALSLICSASLAQDTETIRGLTLLIDYPDLPSKVTVGDIEDLANNNGAAGPNGISTNGSVRDYFRDVSNGKIDYVNTVFKHTASKPKRFYQNYLGFDLPPHWGGKVHAVAGLSSHDFIFFNGSEALTYKRGYRAGGVKKIGDMLPRLPDAWKSGIDASFGDENGTLVLFKEGNFIEYPNYRSTTEVRELSPKPISERWTLPNGWTSIDAAFRDGEKILLSKNELQAEGRISGGALTNTGSLWNLMLGNRVDASVKWGESVYYFGGDRGVTAPKAYKVGSDKLPPSWNSEVDAAIRYPSGNVYLFKGDTWINFTGSKVEEGPKNLRDGWDLPTTWKKVDAALLYPTKAGLAYFFNGSKYVQYKPGDGWTDRKERSISEWDFPDHWDGIDAATPIAGGMVMFFRGAEYIFYKPGKGMIGDVQNVGSSLGFPKNWQGPVDAAFHNQDGSKYLLFGGKNSFAVTAPGYPGKKFDDLIFEALVAAHSKGVDFSTLSGKPSDERVVRALNVIFDGARGVAASVASGTQVGGRTFERIAELAASTSLFKSDDDPSLLLFAHENGHTLFGWPDLYGKIYPRFGLMGGGYSRGNPLPPELNFALKEGWINPVDLKDVKPREQDMTARIRLNVNDLSSVFKYENPNNPNEYFLFQAVAKKGRYEASTGEGLLIWHIDDSKRDNKEKGMSPESHWRVSVEQADGLYELENGKNNGNAGDYFSPGDVFNDNSTPSARWWDGSPSGLDIQEISGKGDLAIMFVYKLQ